MHNLDKFANVLYSYLLLFALIIITMFLGVGCNVPFELPTDNDNNGGSKESTENHGDTVSGNTGINDTTTPITTPTTTNKDDKKQDITDENTDIATQPENPDPNHVFRPCVIVEETVFNKNTDTNVWQTSYYYSPRSGLPIEFTDEGVQFCNGSGCRAGITFSPEERDISNCPSMAFRVQGTIYYQSLGGAGWDDREAPVAVMIQYTDVNGVRHNSLNAFNEGESDDRSTTRMFWWGFGYLDPTKSFYGNFVPSITAVEQGVRFDQTIDLFDKLPTRPKIIHTITIEGSGWNLDSVVHQFAMKPLEAFADPDAPYRDAPINPSGFPNQTPPDYPYGSH